MPLSPEEQGTLEDIRDILVPDEGEALPDDVETELPPRMTGGELMASAPPAVVRGLGGTGLAQ